MGALKPTTLSPPADLSPMDGISSGGPKEEVTLRVVVRLPPQHIIRGVRTCGRAGGAQWDAGHPP